MVITCQPTLEKRTLATGKPNYWIRTVSGWLVSRPTAGEALVLILEQWELWLSLTLDEVA